MTARGLRLSAVGLLVVRNSFVHVSNDVWRSRTGVSGASGKDISAARPRSFLFLRQLLQFVQWIRRSYSTDTRFSFTR